MGARVRKLVSALVVFGAMAGGVAWFLTKPEPWPASHWECLGEPDLANGEQVFWAGGCTSCHAAPKSEGDARLVLAGGLPLKSPFGTFHVPNISPDETAGIGSWTLADFGNAMTRGVGTNGRTSLSVLSLRLLCPADAQGHQRSLGFPENPAEEHQCRAAA